MQTLVDRYPGTLVVVVTAPALARGDEDVLGAAAVVMKPFDVDELLEVLRAVTS